MAIALASGCYAIAHFFFFPALPLYIERLGGSDAEIGLVFGASSAISFLARPFIGGMIQQWGARRVYSVGVALIVVCAATYTLATVFLMVVLARMITGLYSAMSGTAGNTYVADIAPAARRGTAIGIFGTFSMVGQLFGGPIALAILDAPAFRSFDGFIASRLGREPFSLNFYSLFFTSALVALLGLGITRFMRPTRSLKRRDAASVWRLGSLFYRPAVFPGLVILCTMVNLISVYAFLPLMAKRFAIENFGYFFTVQALALMLVRVVSGPLSDRYGRSVVIIPGMALTVVGVGILAFTTTTVPLLISGVVWGLGSGAAQPALTAYVVDRVPVDGRGPAMATFTLGQDIGLSLGATLLGFVLEATNFSVTYLVSGLVALAGIVIYVAGNRPAAVVSSAQNPATSGA